MKNNIFKNIKYNIYKGSAGYIPALFLIIVTAWYVSTYHYQLMMIQGNSMAPLFHNMQLVLLDKQLESFSYGDVIAFQCDGLEAVLVKRVAACPGDTVQIKDGILLVNGAVSEVYGKDVGFEDAGLAEAEIVLGFEEYFVIGDNVAASKDSRYEEIGTVRAENVIGRVMEYRAVIK